jgi:hypothetical protein
VKVDTPSLLLQPEPVVVEQLLGLGRGCLVVARVVSQAGDGRVRELLVLDPVPFPQFERVEVKLRGEVIHDPLNGEGGLGPPGAPVRVGGHFGGEDPGALERVGVHLVDARVHEGAEQRYPGCD